jgi:hypothetical protein
MALLLGYYDGRPLPNLSISLNAYIAVLSSIFKFAIAIPVESSLGQAKWNWFAQQPRPLEDFEHFDNASRGPYGAAVLLLRVRTR